MFLRAATRITAVSAKLEEDMDQETAARFDRIEHITAALAEERRKDREEYKALWRDTQRHIEELAEQGRRTERRIEQLAGEMNDLAEQTAARFRETDERFRELAAAGKATEERIAN